MQPAPHTLGPIPGAGFHLARVLFAVACLVAVGTVAVELQPKWDLLLGQPLLVQAHLYFALAAVVLGAVQLAAPKGGALHRAFGWIWVAMMGVAIVSSGFVMIDTPGRWSWIHGTTVVYGTSLSLAVMFAVRRNIKWHARLMIFTYFVGLIGAILLAFIPDRLLWRAFFGAV